MVVSRCPRRGRKRGQPRIPNGECRIAGSVPLAGDNFVLSMNLILERGSVTRSSLVCKATCCGSQSRAPFRRPGSWSQCMRKVERRLSMNRATSNIERRTSNEGQEPSPHQPSLPPPPKLRRAGRSYGPTGPDPLPSHQNGSGEGTGLRSEASARQAASGPHTYSEAGLASAGSGFSARF